MQFQNFLMIKWIIVLKNCFNCNAVVEQCVKAIEQRFCMECIINLLGNEALMNFISIISSFVIVIITLHVEKRINNKNLTVQERLQKAQLEEEEKLHRESLIIEKEEARANLLPYLKLEQGASIGKRDENLYFPLKITNLGNGGAFDIAVEHEELENTGLSYVYKHDFSDYVVYYQYTGFLSENVLSIGKTGEFELLLNKWPKGGHYPWTGDVFYDSISFSILFKDSLYNQYRQRYIIQFSSTMEWGRIESYLPELVSIYQATK